MIPIVGAVQHYAWGRGPVGAVARFSRHSASVSAGDGGGKFAELWLGTHVNGMSIIADTNAPLITRAPHLPFLLKVLSVGKALSIQAHPDRSLAQVLHARSPEHYPDANHKPELAVALSKFEALCGFRPIAEIWPSVFQGFSELRELVGQAAVAKLQCTLAAPPTEEAQRQALKQTFSTLMSSESAACAAAVSAAQSRLATKSRVSSVDFCPSEALFLRLADQFPGDVGCFAALFLNHITLLPGQAIYLAANEPHAYLFGDCIECMANSDNVVRAGLTPKFKDVTTLTEMLSYTCASIEHQLFCPETTKDGALQIFAPPVDDFALLRVSTRNQQAVILPEGIVRSPSVAVCTHGVGTIKWRNSFTSSSGEVRVSTGDCFYLDAGTSIIVVADDANNAMEWFQAYDPTGS